MPLSTLKIVYFSLFHSHIQYSLLNWGRASKSILYKLKILQNKILRAMLFCSKQDRTNLLYFKLKILKLEDIIAMEYAFIFKFNNHMLPDSFNCYCFSFELASLLFDFTTLNFFHLHKNCLFVFTLQFATNSANCNVSSLRLFLFSFLFYDISCK